MTVNIKYYYINIKNGFELAQFSGCKYTRTLGVTGVFGLCPSSGILKKLDPSSGEGVGDMFSVGSVRKS
jgi:hypothetical protein